ncbi:MAG: DUF2493 domain-containing protein [Clostridia bacterium]|nr:DUF2493 domain-containing protein [Clostridia bacterium]
MKIAVIGSRSIMLTEKELSVYIPQGTSEIVTGGAKGVDSIAKSYALSQGIKLTEFLPEYHKYKKVAPLKRNIKIVEYADAVVAIWDGVSKGTKFVIDTCRRINKPLMLYTVDIQKQKCKFIEEKY